MKEILSEIKTKDAAVKLLGILENALKQCYVQGGDTDSILSKVDFKIELGENPKKTIEETMDKLKSAEIMEITTAVALENDFIDNLYKWFVENKYKNFLLDSNVDESIHGGILIMYKGKYLDASLGTRIFKAVQDEYR